MPREWNDLVHWTKKKEENYQVPWIYECLYLGLWKRMMPFSISLFSFSFFWFWKAKNKKRLETPFFPYRFHFYARTIWEIQKQLKVFSQNMRGFRKVSPNSLPDNFSIKLFFLPSEEQKIGILKWNQKNVHIPRNIHII